VKKQRYMGCTTLIQIEVNVVNATAEHHIYAARKKKRFIILCRKEWLVPDTYLSVCIYISIGVTYPWILHAVSLVGYPRAIQLQAMISQMLIIRITFKKSCFSPYPYRTYNPLAGL